MKVTIALILGLLTAPVFSAAQSLDDKRLDKARDISLQEWRALAQGRTLTYRISGDLWALERYASSGNRVMIQIADGECMEGVWTHENNQFCFAWDSGELSCFRHVRQGEDIFVVPMQGDQPSGSVQMMTSISDTPLACGPAVTS